MGKPQRVGIEPKSLRKEAALLRLAAVLGLVLASCFCLHAALAGEGVKAEAQASPRAEDVLPQSTLAYIELPNLAQSRSRLSESALGQIRNEPSVDRFLSEGFPLAQSLQAALVERLGFGWAELRDAFTGQVTLALLDARPLESETLTWLGLLADVDAASPAFGALRDLLLAKYAEATQSEASEVEVAGLPATMLREQDDSTLLAVTRPGGAGSGTADRFLVVRGPDREHTQELLAGLLGRQGGKLSAEPTFRSARQRSSLVGEDLYAYVDLRRLLAALAPELPETFQQALELTGLADLQAVTLAVSIEADGAPDPAGLGRAPGVRDELCLLAPLDPAGPRRGLLALAPAATLDESTWLRYVPVDAVSFSAGGMELGATYRLLWQLSELLLGPAAAHLHEQLAEFESQVGVSIDGDIFDQLGPEMVQFTVLPRLGPTLGRADTLMVLAVRDRERLQSALEKLKTYFQSPRAIPQPTDQKVQVQWEERDFDGRPLTRLLIANPWQPLEPGFTFYRDESVSPPRELLLVALRFQSLKNMLSYVAGSPAPQGPTAEGPAQPLGDVRANPDFRQLRSALPAEVNSLGYSDLRRQFVATYPLVVAWASLMQGASGRALFDPDLIPPPEDIARHLFGLVIVTRPGGPNDQTSIRTQTYGPISYSTLLAGAGGALAFALPTTIRQHQLATRKDCQGHLERLGVELSLYASTHDGRFPKDLKELVDAQPSPRPSADGHPLPVGEGPGEGPSATPEWLRCPGQFPSVDIGYEYVPGAGKDSPPETIVAYDRKGNHPGGRNVLAADGRVTWLKESVFQQNLKNQNPGSPVQEGSTKAP